MKTVRLILLLILICLSACGQTPAASPPIIVMTAPAPPMPAVTDTSLPVSSSTLTADSTIFGAMKADEIQAQDIEAVPNDIFKKTMDGLVAAGSISDYQITTINVTPGDENFIAEITYNVKTSDPTWLADGGMQSGDGWINGNCARFDLVITDTEFQLTNRHICD